MPSISDHINRIRFSVYSALINRFWSKHPIYDPLGVGSYMNELKQEFLDTPLQEKVTQLRRVLKRELILHLIGQKKYQVDRIPDGTQKILWVFDWLALGDSIMDLSQRFSLPESISVDLCITHDHGQADLFIGDKRFNRIFTNIKDCPKTYDFILFDRIGLKNIRLKTRHFPKIPFATLMGHQSGARYARNDFSALRIAQLLNSVIQPPNPPRISPAITAGITPQAGRIAVVLGGQDGRRRWRDWPGLLEALVRDWPTATSKPLFALIGNGPSAQEDLATIPSEFVEHYCTIRLDLPNLVEAAREIQRCALFIGADGGLMHIASALDKPGVALFAGIRPEWRLLPDNPLTPLYTPGAMADIPLTEIVAAFLATLCQTATLAPSPTDHEVCLHSPALHHQ